MPTTNKVANRLINEKSPYLLQHANNPVNWYPWGDEAFNEARSENKPIFLSIGYSTCHWCHVMEHESFEDNEVADLMNENFVSIKVDREERPDIDSIYMNGCQRMTGQGGWPLTVLMTPEKKPFFFASYIPKYSVHGVVGMIELIKKVKVLWENENDSVIDSAERITESLKNISIQNSDKDLRTSVIHSAFIELENSFDDVHGGFGYEPKFPVPENILFLFRYYKKTKDKKALNMALKTLDLMAEGGIFDHVGYGFHRYSTDAQWLVPHFEKMLYDQALISYAYVEAYQITQDDRYKEFAEKIFEYVLRDMRSEEGVFYSAEDADSEGEEGKFYLWTYEELKKVLSEDELSIVNKVFGIENEGNFINQLTGEKTGYNIIYYKMKPSEMDNNMRDRVESIRQKLYNARSKRIRPHRDDKVLIDWNGLMISSLAKAGAVFNNTEYTNAAKKAAEFILNSIKENGNLFHRYVKGEWNFRANADDYAFLIHALIELYEADFNIDFLKWALKLNDNFIENFWDEQSGGFYFTQKGGTDVFMRMKEVYDGAVPSGNSIEFLNLIKLSRLTGNQSLEKYADSIQKVFSKQIQENPSSYTCFLMAFIYFTEPSFEIVVTGGNNSEEMLKLINKKYIPNKVVVFSPINEYNADLYETIGYIENYKDINGEAAAYICRGFTCEAPIKDINKLSNILDI